MLYRVVLIDRSSCAPPEAQAESPNQSFVAPLTIFDAIQEPGRPTSHCLWGPRTRDTVERVRLVLSALERLHRSDSYGPVILGKDTRHYKTFYPRDGT